MTSETAIHTLYNSVYTDFQSAQVEASSIKGFSLLEQRSCDHLQSYKKTTFGSWDVNEAFLPLINLKFNKSTMQILVEITKPVAGLDS